jgi:hypothetical protein
VAAISTVATVGASIYSANKQSKAAKNAAQASQQATDQTNALNKYIFDTQRSDNAPWRTAGAAALARISNPSTVMGNFQASPDYNFRLQQGLAGVTQNQAVNGLLKSGSSLKALNDYAQNTASGEFGNWWNRQAGLANVGQAANAANAQAGQFYAGQVGNALSANASNQASSYYARANAQSQMAGNVAGAVGWAANNIPWGGGGSGYNPGWNPTSSGYGYQGQY